MGAYENPITYVDTESAKYYAGAISQIGQVGAKLITDETERRRKEDEENKLRNEKRQQRFKKYQLETQSNVNDALKTLDFSENESFRKGMGNIIDEYALAKSSALLNFSGNQLGLTSSVDLSVLSTSLTSTFVSSLATTACVSVCNFACSSKDKLFSSKEISCVFVLIVIIPLFQVRHSHLY